MTGDTREERRQVLISAIEMFLDHIEEDFDNNPDFDVAALGSVMIAGEIHAGMEGEYTVPSYWCSNENAIWQRGFFELLADYKKVNVREDD